MLKPKPAGAGTPAQNSAPPASCILHPASLLSGLRLVARQLADSVLPGPHASRQPGLTREFSQYRSYQPGDDPRHIDWKLYARSDRYFLRESEIETAFNVRIILDATASMQHVDTTGSAAGVGKFDVARVAAAALAALAQSQGDPVELHAVAAGKVTSAGGRGQRQPFEQILHALERLKPAGRWPQDINALRAGCARSGGTSKGGSQRALIFFLTDLYEDEEEIRAAIAPLHAAGNELVLLHLLGRDELDFPFTGSVRFEDWETGEMVETDADRARDAWMASLGQRAEAWKRVWPGAHFEYLPVHLDEPLERTLRSYLLRRMKS